MFFKSYGLSKIVCLTNLQKFSLFVKKLKKA